MNDVVIVAILSLAGTVSGSLLGVLAANKLTVYRIGELEKKVDKHNRLVERTYKIENDIKILKKDVGHCHDGLRKLKEDFNNEN